MKQRKVVMSPEAEADLLAIYRWIRAASSTATALRYIERLDVYCQSFDIASERGTRRDDLIPGLRTIGFEKRVTIIFIVEESEVSILRLFYGGQDWESAFEP